MTVFLRSAAKADLEEVSDLLREAWHRTYDDIYGRERVREITTSWHSVEALSENLARPRSEFVVADSKNGIAGMAYASMLDEHALMLHQLYVHPARQGQGTGALLLHEVCGCFPEAQTTRLEVERANTGAVKFYERHGFVRAGTTGNCGKPDSGIEALIYERPLNQN